MAEFTTHTPGTFTWPELATTDQKSGVAFYRSLFGWDANEMPLGPGETYSMFQLKGKEVGAACTMQTQERQMGVPPHWNSYVTVKNVDESAKKAESLGAKLFMPPFDVMDAGRMAVLQDPTGAVFQSGSPSAASARRFSTSRAPSAGPSSRRATPKPPKPSTRSSSDGRRSTAARARRWNTPSSASAETRPSA